MTAARRSAAFDSASPHRAPTSLSVGFLALLPLLAAYEWSLPRLGPGVRNTSELLVSIPLSPLGTWAGAARLALLGLVALVSFGVVRARGWELGRAVLRVVAEGVVAGIALGPALLVATSLLGEGASVGLGGTPGASAPLARTAFVFGGSGYEELVFRVGLYSLLFTLARRLALALGRSPRLSGAAADGLALLGSAALFAAMHLDVLASRLGGSGEPFHVGLFAWRFAAGLLLGALFRWRGAGVAGWAHGLFNASLVLGAGPGVLS